MYVFDEFIDLGLKEGEEWSSEDHRIVAQKILLCNPKINNRSLLVEGVSIINQIPSDQIKQVTVENLWKKDVPEYPKYKEKNHGMERNCIW